MKHKLWTALIVLFFVEMAAGGVLMDKGLLPQTVAAPMIWSGLIGFFVSFVGMIRHPAWVCTNCGKGVHAPRWGTSRKGGFRCPHCGAMLYADRLKKAE